MARENRFVILLTNRERQTIEALARLEKLPASTLARKRLLTEAEQRGVIALAEYGDRDGQAVQATAVPVAA